MPADSLRARQTRGFRQTRRSMLGAAMAACLPGLWPLVPAVGQAKPRRLIDVHHHFHTLELMRWWGRDSLDPAWTTAGSLAAMDGAGVTTALLSVTQPGIWQASDAAGSVSMARSCNERMARTVRDHPGRFGFFLALPLPQVGASLAEIGYGLDVLKADGVGLLSSYDDKYLGDPAFAPVFQELNRRRAVVYVHPMAPRCCSTLVPGIPATAFEVPTDTTRTIESLLISGTLAHSSEIRFIFAHGGGTLPFVAERIIRVATQAPASPAPAGPARPSADALRTALRGLHFDTASVANPAAWAALTNFTSPNRILFGSDYPYQPMDANLGALRAMEQRFELGRADIEAIEYGNARQLMPARSA